ncbi:MAG: ABC transporter permease [Jatrophihabitans sp.]
MTTFVETTHSAAPAPARPATRGIPFSRLVRVEWGKSIDTRAARWLLLIVAVGTAAMMLAPILATKTFDQNYGGYLRFCGFVLTVLLPVVAILTMTSEWSQRTVLTTFTQEPRRNRVISAKIAATGILTAAAVVFGAAITALALAVAAASGRHVDLHLSPSVAVGFLLMVVLNMAMAVGFGGVLHNSAAAIVAFFLVPTLFSLLSTAVHSAGEWLDPGQSFNWIGAGDWNDHTAKILVTMTLWVVLPLIAGFVRTARREIN